MAHLNNTYLEMMRQNVITVTKQRKLNVNAIAKKYFTVPSSAITRIKAIMKEYVNSYLGMQIITI